MQSNSNESTFNHFKLIVLARCGVKGKCRHIWQMYFWCVPVMRRSLLFHPLTKNHGINQEIRNIANVRSECWPNVISLAKKKCYFKKILLLISPLQHIGTHKKYNFWAYSNNLIPCRIWGDFENEIRFFLGSFHSRISNSIYSGLLIVRKKWTRCDMLAFDTHTKSTKAISSTKNCLLCIAVAHNLRRIWHKFIQPRSH